MTVPTGNAVPADDAGAGAALPLLSWRGALAAFAVAVLLCWPMLLTTAPLAFPDTTAYFKSGAKIWGLLRRMAETVLPVGDVGLMGPDEGAVQRADGMPDGGARSQRSAVYSIFVYATAGMTGFLTAVPVVQTAMTMLMAFALIPADVLRAAGSAPGRMEGWASVRRRGVAAALLLAGVTTLPWYASFATPDILAAAVVLFYAVLACRIDRVSRRWRIVLVAIATFAVSSHYGHIPLAAGLAAVMIALRAWRGTFRMAVLAMALLPIALTAAVNMTGSRAVTGEASIAPKRLPILLARSLEDGPANDYLRDVCPDGSDLAICELFPTLPDTITKFLWDDEGLISLSPRDLDRIRNEEATILWRSFRAYPLRQAGALLGNGLRQIVSVGTDDLFPALQVDLDGPRLFRTSDELRDSYAAFDVFDTVTRAGTVAGILLALWLGFRRRFEVPEKLAMGVCVAGILGNALIFGGLSAPVDRYQSRLVWIIPALALLVWVRSSRQTKSRGKE